MEATEVSVADALREVADFLDANPDLEPGSLTDVQMRCRTKDDLRTLAKALVAATGRAEKTDMGEYLQVYARFGGIKVWGAIEREQVCRKVVTGIRHVPEQTVEAHDVETVTWICDDPILAGDEAVDGDA